jgi:uncharacterized protein (TIGR03083 family)
MTTGTRVETIMPITRDEAPLLAAAENARMAELLAGLDHRDWALPTDCTAWDVRALAGHVLGGIEMFASVRELVHVMRAAGRARGDGPWVDGMTAVQVRERAGLTTAELVARVRDVAERAARGRARIPGPLRAMRTKQEVGGQTETWRLGYLVDVILTRDTWMHRVDITRATGREMQLTPEHDGRIVADVVAEWQRRHGRPFTLRLTGPAGGEFVAGDGGDEVELDAVEFCRALSGRSPMGGLLAQEVPF